MILHITIVSNMIIREISPYVEKLFRQYPFVTVTGPRQSGKTILCQQTFPHLDYANLEIPEVREFADADPVAFLSKFKNGAILDEIQLLPKLTSYLQVMGDEKRENSLFVLTGSQNFSLTKTVTQSLAGRTAMLCLLPLSLRERNQLSSSNQLDDIMFSGFFPRIFDQGIHPSRMHADYYATYIERDIFRTGQVRDMLTFQRFIRMCAGRVGQIINLSSFASDIGVSHTTVYRWLSMLELGYTLFRLPPYFSNIRKRLVRSPKLYFYDVGLVCYLLGIHSPEQLGNHPLRGSIFENFIVVEALKSRFNRGRAFNLFFVADHQKMECDLLYDLGTEFAAIEIKAGATLRTKFFNSLKRVDKVVPNISRKFVVYGGLEHQWFKDGQAVPFSKFGGLLESLEIDLDLNYLVEKSIPRQTAASNTSNLDLVFHRHIRPTLDELEPILEDRVARLFENSESMSQVRIGARVESSPTLLERKTWPDFRKSFFENSDSDHSRSQSLQIQHSFNLTGYIGGSGNDLQLTLSMIWHFQPDGVQVEVSLNQESFPKFVSFYPYEKIASQNMEYKELVTDIKRLIVEFIKEKILEI